MPLKKSKNRALVTRYELKMLVRTSGYRARWFAPPSLYGLALVSYTVINVPYWGVASWRLLHQ